MTIDIPEGYEALGLALGQAVAQAACGKGSERHAEEGEAFSDQLIMSIPKRLGLGGECFCLGQALKKICESRRLPQARARAELLGAINYLAAAWCLLGGRESVFAPEDADAPRTKKELLKRIREVNPAVYPQEDYEAPLFPDGTPVEFLPGERGVWEPALYRGLDSDGLHLVAARGGVLACVPAYRIRKPEDAAAPLFPERAPVECRPPLESEWSPALYIGVDPAGYHIVECRGVRMHLSADAVRKPENREAPLFPDGTFVECLSESGVWEQAIYHGTDPDGLHRVSSCGVRYHVPADRIRNPKDALRFQKGDSVEYKLPDGTWAPASFICMDGGYAVLECGGPRFSVLSFDVCPAKKS